MCFAPCSHPFSLSFCFHLFLLLVSSLKSDLGAQCRGPKGHVKNKRSCQSLSGLHTLPRAHPVWEPSIKTGGRAVLPWRDLLWQHTFPTAVKHEAG